MLIYKFDNIPQLNSSVNQIDGWSLMCPSNLTNDNLFIYFINNQQTSKHQSIVFGIRELNKTELEVYCTNIPLNPPITNRPLNFSSDYKLQIFTSGCYYLDSSFTWQSDGLTVGPLTNHIQTQCFSTHLSTFAGGFLVLPTSINWKYVFANADFNRNRTIYLTVIIILLIYILFLIYSRHQNRKDAEKLAATALLDNCLNDKYFYQLLIFTGVRRGSGTNNTVQFILSAINGQTEIRTLSNSNRKILQRGSIDSFLIAVPKSLGCLTTLRIWLKNSMEKKTDSWFFEYAVVRDLQTMKNVYFICQNWLKVDKRNKSIEHVLSAASNSEKRKFRFHFVHYIYSNLIDDHLWFSIFSRPPSSSFTRVQRCTCCFVLLFTGMLLSILYYDQKQEIETNQTSDGLSIGPFYFSREQIGIGIICDVLLFIPSIFLVMFFRRIRQRHSPFQISPIRQMNMSTTNQIQIQKKKDIKISFPWWCLFIAYGLSYLMIIVSILLIIARGIEFGDVKVRKWLGSLTINFFSSVLLSQPIKVLGLTIFFILISSRRQNNNQTTVDYIDENENIYLNGNDEYNLLHNDQCNIQDIEIQELRNNQRVSPLQTTHNRLSES